MCSDIKSFRLNAFITLVFLHADKDMHRKGHSSQSAQHKKSTVLLTQLHQPKNIQRKNFMIKLYVEKKNITVIQ